MSFSFSATLKNVYLPMPMSDNKFIVIRHINKRFLNVFIITVWVIIWIFWIYLLNLTSTLH